jgi:hypothetical protein
MITKEEGNKCQSDAIVNFLNLWQKSKPNGKSKEEQRSSLST